MSALSGIKDDDVKNVEAQVDQRGEESPLTARDGSPKSCASEVLLHYRDLILGGAFRTSSFNPF